MKGIGKRKKILLLSLPFAIAIIFSYVPRGRFHYNLTQDEFVGDEIVPEEQIQAYEDYLNENNSDSSFGFPVRWSNDPYSIWAYNQIASEHTGLKGYLNYTANKNLALGVDASVGFVIGATTSGIIALKLNKKTEKARRK